MASSCVGVGLDAGHCWGLDATLHNVLQSEKLCISEICLHLDKMRIVTFFNLLADSPYYDLSCGHLSALSGNYLIRS